MTSLESNIGVAIKIKSTSSDISFLCSIHYEKNQYLKKDKCTYYVLQHFGVCGRDRK